MGRARWHTSVILDIWESTNRKTVVQAGPGMKQDPISKITNTERTGGVAKVVECLPSIFEVLSSNPNTIYYISIYPYKYIYLTISFNIHLGNSALAFISFLLQTL
jgi:hypothetical protein